jgi:lipoate-protein ligase B
MSNPLLSATCLSFGCQPLATVLTQQLDLLAQVRQDPGKAFILYGEHPPVYTAGKGCRAGIAIPIINRPSSPAALLRCSGPHVPEARLRPSASHALHLKQPINSWNGYNRPDRIMGIPVESVSRGGQLTYHGPGQLVIYPVVSVRAMGGVPGLLSGLLAWVRQALDLTGLETVPCPPCADPRQPATGIWVPGNTVDAAPVKIASVGLAVKHWVSYHGLALNISNDLTPFYAIDPCGFPASTMGSVHTQWLQQHPGTLPPSLQVILANLGLKYSRVE